MATKSDLVSRTLWRLRARGTGQSPMTEDATEVTAVVDDKLADLALRKVIYIGDSDDLPDGTLDWLSRLMELTVIAAFEGDPPDYAARMEHAESMLRAQQASDTFPPQQAEYY